MTAQPKTPSLVRTLVRIGLALGGAAVLFTGLVGLLHLPGAKPLLLTLLGRCPVGFDVDMPVAERDAARATVVDTVRGDATALSRPALGFTLDATSRADVTAWAGTHQVLCTPADTQIRCQSAPAAALGTAWPADHVTFSFDAHDRLVAVQAGSDLTAQEAVDRHQAAAATALAASGPGATGRGEPTADWLAGGPLRMLNTEARYTDYRVRISATNMGSGRITFRELYQSLAAPVAATAQR